MDDVELAGVRAFIKSTIYLYDGSPFYPSEEVLWNFIDEEEINFMGVSAKYIDALSKQKIKIIDKYKLLN